ncbi:hypothetical protein [Paenibacillus pectinilyticus]|nr:hypothetical protein [Paenibacillus pectinilyticus]
MTIVLTETLKKNHIHLSQILSNVKKAKEEAKAADLPKQGA